MSPILPCPRRRGKLTWRQIFVAGSHPVTSCSYSTCDLTRKRLPWTTKTLRLKPYRFAATAALTSYAAISLNRELWRLRAEVKCLFQHDIQQLVELPGPKSRSQSFRTHSGNLVAAKGVHPDGLVARAGVNRAPKQVLGLCMVPTHGLHQAKGKGECVKIFQYRVRRHKIFNTALEFRNGAPFR